MKSILDESDNEYSKENDIKLYFMWWRFRV